MDRKDCGSNPHVTLWVGIGFCCAQNQNQTQNQTPEPDPDQNQKQTQNQNQNGGASHTCAGIFVHIRGMHSRALSCNAVLTGAYRIDPKKCHPTWIKTIATRGRCGVE